MMNAQAAAVLEAAQAPTTTRDLRIDSPSPPDGGRIWELVRELDALEENSAYAYLLFCKHFADACVVAEQDDRLAGFVLAYPPPVSDDTVFVWQVGVAPWARRRGVGMRMLEALVDRLDDVEYLEASVTPDNTASRRLFRAFADRCDAPCEVREFLPADLFPGNHEDEELFRIGPLA